MALDDDLNRIRNEFENLDDALTSLNAQIQSGIQASLNNMDATTASIARSFGRDLARSVGISNRSLNEQEKIIEKIKNGQNASKEIQRERAKIEQQRQITLRKLELLERQGVSLSAQQKDELINTLETQQEQLDNLEAQNRIMVNSTGVLGHLVSGISALGKQLGLGAEFSEMLDSSLADARANGGGLSKFTESLAGNLGGSVKRLDIGLFLIKKSLEAFKQIDTRVASMRNNLGLSGIEAIHFNDELATTAISTNLIGVNVDTLNKTVGDLNQSLGGIAATFDQDLLVSATFLRERFKLSEEAIAGMAKQALSTGKSLEGIENNQLSTLVAAEKEFKVRFNTRQILDEANKISGALRLNLEKAPGGLVRAVAQAKLLGLSIEQTAQMAGKLLNFEDSISAELEAELLTGKQLNLEQARYLALQGNSAGAASEIAKQIGSSAELAKMNVIQQEALAAAAGLTTEQLADALRNQEGIATQAGKSAERTAEQAKNAATALSVQDKLAGAVEKLAGILQFSAAAMIALVTGIGLAFTGIGALGAVGIGLAAGAATYYGLNALRGDDIVSPGYGKRTLLAPEGAISLNDRDTVIAGTNLGGDKPSNTTIAPSIDISPLVTQMSQMNNILNQILNKEGIVTLDGTKVGTALTVGSYKIQ